MIVQDHHPLQTLTTFGTPATAQRVVTLQANTPDAPSRLDRDVDELLASGLLDGPYLILGGGSNVVFTQDYPGTVIRLGSGSIQSGSGEDGNYLTAGAGLELDSVVNHCVERGYCGGVENLSAIPGTVGGAVVQNAGAYGVETGEFVERVEALDLRERRRVSLTREECRFAYRTSLFKEQSGRYLILEVRFRFSTAAFAPTLKYRALADELQRRGIASPTQRQMRDLIADIRWAKLPRPEEHGSAGSFFKNPVVDEAVYRRLREQHPDMPEAHASAEGCKLSAGWLIDRAGWKGRTLGRAGVWPQQALVLYNADHCTGQEVIALAQAIQDNVLQKFGVALQPEAILI